MNSLSLKFGNIATEPSFERMFWDLKTFLRHADWHGGTGYYPGYSTHKFSFVKTATLCTKTRSDPCLHTGLPNRSPDYLVGIKYMPLSSEIISSEFDLMQNDSISSTCDNDG